jgi:simple sugar transport system substrate-binding protein
MKKLIALVLSLMMLLSVVGCAAPKAAEAPAQGEAASAEGAGEFSDINVVWLGGSETDTFTESMRKGAELAEKVMGCKVEYLYTQWDASKTVELLSQSVARDDVDVIAMVGMATDDAIEEYVEAGIEKGIVITGMNTINERMVKEHLADGFGSAAADLYGSGYTVGTQAALRSGAAAGSTALVMGYLGESGARAQRAQGIIDGLEENGMKVEYIEFSAEAKADGSQATATIVSYLSTHPETAIMVLDGGSQTALIQSFLDAAGKKPGEIYCAGFDISAGAIDGIKNGYVGFVLDQQQYLQSFLPIVCGCLSAKWGFSGFNIDTGAALIDATNAEAVSALAAEGIR